MHADVAMSGSGSLRVLMLEDDAGDAGLLQQTLRRAGLSVVVRQAGDHGAFLEALADFRPDVVLSEILPRVDVFSMLARVRRRAPGVPVIIVTKVLADALVARLLAAGAVDYLLKDRLARLGSAVLRAVAAAAPARPQQAALRSAAAGTYRLHSAPRTAAARGVALAHIKPGASATPSACSG